MALPTALQVYPCGACGGNATAIRISLHGMYGAIRVDYSCACGITYRQLVAGQLLQSLTSEESAPELESVPASAPVIQGSVIGYRAWRIMDWQLCGTGVSRAWVPDVNEATCDAGHELWPSYLLNVLAPHAAPGKYCHCGINALARFTREDEHWRGADVFGAIEAWGEEPVAVAGPGDVAGVVAKQHEKPGAGFMLHPTGFRARYGKVVLLAIEDDMPAAKRAAIRALAREHGADVCKRDHLEDAAKEHGQLVPDELLKQVADEQPEQAFSYGAIPLGTIQVSGNLIVSTAAYISYGTSAAQIRRTRESSRQRGIKQTLGHPGPPGFGKWKRGDTVKDRQGVIWRCDKGGRPGHWERAE